MFLQPSWIAAATGGKWTPETPRDPFVDVHFDSRLIGPGELFFALRGPARKGSAFIGDAFQRGAAAAVVDQPGSFPLPVLRVPDSLRALQQLGRRARQEFQGTVVGLTGSNGKTSTKDLLLRILDPGAAVGTRGNFNNHIGLPWTLLHLCVGSPKARVAVLETGINHPGEMKLLGDLLQPDVGLLTSVGRAHLGHFESIEALAAEKSILLPPKGWSVLPAEVLRFSAVQERVAPGSIIAIEEGAAPVPTDSHWEVIRYRLRLAGEGFIVCTEPGEFPAVSFRVGTSSRGMASNAVLAAATGMRLGVEARALPERFADWKPTPLRGELIRHEGVLYYIDCYNANPESMRDALDSFDRLTPEGSRCFYLGSMEELGDGEEGIHEEIASTLPLRSGDEVVLVGRLADAYRSGLPVDAAKGGFGVRVGVFPDAEAARKWKSDCRARFFKGSRSVALERLIDEKVRRVGAC